MKDYIENRLTGAVIENSMASNFLAPVKTDKQIYENSMLEEDPNANSAVTHEEKVKPRWGPHHKGAQELANLYSRGKIGTAGIFSVICELARGRISENSANDFLSPNPPLWAAFRPFGIQI